MSHTNRLDAEVLSDVHCSRGFDPHLICDSHKADESEPFFLDCFDIGEEYDKTTAALKQIYDLAANKPRFDCKDLVHIKY